MLDAPCARPVTLPPMKKAVDHLQAADRRMAGLIARVGPCRLRYSPPSYETLARSIVSQQLSAKAADTIYSRLLAAAGPSGLTPASALALSHDELRSCGLSQAKARYLHALAETTRSGALDFACLPKLPDHDVIAHLTAVHGVGIWTAQMFLIFALRRRDVLPTGDIGIRNAIHNVYRLKTPPTPAQMERIGRPWRPYASIACWYLWQSLDLTSVL